MLVVAQLALSFFALSLSDVDLSTGRCVADTACFFFFFFLYGNCSRRCCHKANYVEAHYLGQYLGYCLTCQINNQDKL